MSALDLIAKLRAAIDEDERIALAAKGNTSGQWASDDQTVIPLDAIALYDGSGRLTLGHHRHITHHDPARVLRQVAAHRKILELHQPNPFTNDLVNLDDGSPVATCISCGGWHTMKTGTSWPCDTVLALAEGYGIEVQT